jgi:hypothetical protein
VSTTVEIDPRFCGPPGSGNGGYACGLLAAAVPPGPVEVALRRPPPLARPLTLAVGDDEAKLLDGDEIVASARPVAYDLDPGPVVSIGDARSVIEAFDERDYRTRHPYATCFTCGPAREPGDGLRIFPGSGTRPGVVAWTWRPADAGIADPVPLPVLWAALDCLGGMAWIEHEGIGAAVLGRLAVRVLRAPAADEEVVATGWQAGRDGRKLAAGTALRGPDGEVLAMGRATWIELTPEQAAAFETG